MNNQNTKKLIPMCGECGCTEDLELVCYQPWDHEKQEWDRSELHTPVDILYCPECDDRHDNLEMVEGLAAAKAKAKVAA